MREGRRKGAKERGSEGAREGAREPGSQGGIPLSGSKR